MKEKKLEILIIFISNKYSSYIALDFVFYFVMHDPFEYKSAVIAKFALFWNICPSKCTRQNLFT